MDDGEGAGGDPVTPPRVLGRAEWRYFRHPGTDRATLSSTDRGYHLSGQARLRFPEGPTTMTYAIGCDAAWRPQSARINVQRGRSKQFLELEMSEEGNWKVNGFHHRELLGFTDLDLSASPSTNTLAIRRLDLPVGSAAEIQTAWVVFPDLEVRPVHQRYHRMSEHHYRYEGLHNGFVAEFDVDDLGLVVNYPDFWERTDPPRRRPAAARPRRARREG